MIQFDDSVTPANLPATQEYGVFYVDGLYANEAGVRARLPHAKAVAGITAIAPGKTGKTVAFCDCETGDLTPQQAVAWVEAQIKAGVELVGVYANLSTWAAGLYADLSKYSKRIKRWCAAYDQDPSLTLTYLGNSYTFDAHQWAGGITAGVDKNVAADDFFTPYKPVPLVSYHYDYYDAVERPVIEAYDRKRKHPIIYRRALQALEVDLANLVTDIENVMRKSDPKGLKFHRAYRLNRLRTRATGGVVKPDAGL